MSPEPSKPPPGYGDFAGQLFGSGVAKTPAFDFSSALFSLAGAVAPPPPPPVIEDRWFKDQTINLDGYTFERCRFDRCQLITKMATFRLRNCFIDPTCRVLFDGPALKTVRLLMHVLALSGRIPYRSEDAGVYPAGNNDGTFTLE